MRCRVFVKWISYAIIVQSKVLTDWVVNYGHCGVVRASNGIPVLLKQSWIEIWDLKGLVVSLIFLNFYFIRLIFSKRVIFIVIQDELFPSILALFKLLVLNDSWCWILIKWLLNAAFFRRSISDSIIRLLTFEFLRLARLSNHKILIFVLLKLKVVIDLVVIKRGWFFDGALAGKGYGLVLRRIGLGSVLGWVLLLLRVLHFFSWLVCINGSCSCNHCRDWSRAVWLTQALHAAIDATLAVFNASFHWDLVELFIKVVIWEIVISHCSLFY